MQKQLTKRQAEVLMELIQRYSGAESRWFSRYVNVVGYSNSEYPIASIAVFRQLVEKGALIAGDKRRFHCFDRHKWRLNLESEFVKSVLLTGHQL